MKLLKRLIELAFVLLVISLFMKNKDVELAINYFGLTEPIKVQFWELVTFCVSLGIIIAAVGDLITQLKWVRERRKLIKTDKEHQKTVDDLNSRIEGLESEIEAVRSEKERLEKDLEAKTKELGAAKKLPETTPSGTAGKTPLTGSGPGTAAGTAAKPAADGEPKKDEKAAKP